MFNNSLPMDKTEKIKSQPGNILNNDPQPGEANPGNSINLSEISVEGTIRVVLTRNIGRRSFPRRTGQSGKSHFRWFQQLRGSREFAAAVIKLSEDEETKTPYTRTRSAPNSKVQFKPVNNILDPKNLYSRGYQLGVLTQNLIRRDAMPVYEVLGPLEARIQDDKVIDDVIMALKKDGSNYWTDIANKINGLLTRELEAWDNKRIMLSRYGVFQVIFERHCLPGAPDTAENDSLLQNIVGSAFGLDARRPLLKELEMELGKPGVEQDRHKIDGLHKLASLIDYSLQWVCVNAIVKHFIEAINCELVIDEVDEKFDEHGKIKDPERIHALKFNKIEEPYNLTNIGASHNLRFRYTIFEITRLMRASDSSPIDMDDVKKELATLLENAADIVQDGRLHETGEHLVPESYQSFRKQSVSTQTVKADPNGGVSIVSPDFKDAFLGELFHGDTSRWNQEFCIFTNDNALICYEDPERQIGVPNPATIRYKEYWECLIRAICYILELRTVARLLDSETSYAFRLVNDWMIDLHKEEQQEAQGTASQEGASNQQLNVPRQGSAKAPKQSGANNNKVTASMSTRRFAQLEDLDKHLTEFVPQISNYARLTARLRQFSLPSNIGTADYAVHKYAKLNRVLGMQEALEHAMSNIQMVNSFITYFEDMRMAAERARLFDEGRKLQEKATNDSKTVVLLTLVLAWLGLPVVINELGKEDSYLHYSANYWLGNDFRVFITNMLTILSIFLTIAVVVAIGDLIRHTLQRSTRAGK
ncbi:MAG: hypothetical protein WCD37_11365 [Chloroflexia bacterium]